MIFETTEQQDIFIDQWKSKHRKTCIAKTATIGGRFTYHFEQTSIGMFIRVTCVCGESLNLGVAG
jgi:hypothetical protein